MKLRFASLVAAAVMVGWSAFPNTPPSFAIALTVAAPLVVHFVVMGALTHALKRAGRVVRRIDRWQGGDRRGGWSRPIRCGHDAGQHEPGGAGSRRLRHHLQHPAVPFRHGLHGRRRHHFAGGFLA